MSEPVFIAIDDATELTKQAWTLLTHQGLDFDWHVGVQPVLDFLAQANSESLTTLKQRQVILDQATLIFDHFYPHMPFKRDIYHFTHPSEFLKENVAPILANLSEVDFHSWMIAAFSLVRDAHTLYGAPGLFQDAVAFLPFQVRAYMGDDKLRHYIVRALMNSTAGGGFGHPLFAPGAEILFWGESPIDLHVGRAAGRLPGGNVGAEITRAARHITLRPLTFCQPPFDDEMPAVTIYYRPAGSSETHGIRFPWGVMRGRGAQKAASVAFSLSPLAEAMKIYGQFIHRRGELFNEKDMAVTEDKADTSTLPAIFDLRYTNGPRKNASIDVAQLVDNSRPNARFGYVKIKSFNGGFGATESLVAEFQRILTRLDEKAPDGLVLDLRSNPGGDVNAAERMLQMLTPGPITPARFHLANTPAILDVLKRIKADSDGKLSDATAVLREWVDDADKPPLPQGDRLTSGHALTDPREANGIGQIYQGPVYLLIDALTYSAADIFAAGFQDHAIGEILGVDHTTGAGGASVSAHDDLVRMLAPAGINIQELPNGATMSVALRRCSRVGRFEGEPVEDVGVGVDGLYGPGSAEDVAANYPGLIGLACRSLGLTSTWAFAPLVRFTADRPAAVAGGGFSVAVNSAGIDSFHFLLDEKLAFTADLAADVDQTFTVPAIAGQPEPTRVRIEGYRNGKLAAVRKFDMKPPVVKKSTRKR